MVVDASYILGGNGIVRMTLVEADLYARICQFKLDKPEATFPFSAKLAWEYRWTGIYTCRAIQEYKKFIFLAMVAKHIVSPSAPVDRVWHLHLLDTHSYWDKFCGEVLERPLHHTPSLGGQQEGIKYQQLYQLTLATYRQYFGTPPEDIWHPARLRSERFAYQWIDRDAHWVIPKLGYWLNSQIRFRW